MKISILDPVKSQHEYLTKRYFQPLWDFARDNIPNIKFGVESIKANLHHEHIFDSVVLVNADLLTPDVVSVLKNNNNKVVGFSVTDSSYVSQSCRSGEDLKNIDLMFMLTGIQKVNFGHEMVVNGDYSIGIEKREFLPEKDWIVFDEMRCSGRIQSLPYVHWETQASVEPKPYNLRSQKALIRGGHHMRRYLLALQLMNIDRLDINSGFVTSPYFQNEMNPQFRYCEECRNWWSKTGSAPRTDGLGKSVSGSQCTNIHWKPPSINLSNLGEWNNKCPASFYAVAEMFGVPSGSMHLVERLLNARWIPQQEHLEMLARITFTSDLKWLFSIYAAQRFWDAAQVGCINLLPERTAQQEYFPAMYPHIHYVTYNEKMDDLRNQSEISEGRYNLVSKEAKALYDQWMRPTKYKINSNLLSHIFGRIKDHCG